MKRYALAIGLLAMFQATAGGSEPAPPSSMRLISQSQYVSTIARVFGSDVAVKVRLAPVSRGDGLLGVGASTAVLTTGGLDPLEGSARAIAAQVVDPARRGFLLGCAPKDGARADPACARQFLGRTGRLLFRRPLSERELAGAVAVAAEASEVTGDFYAGVAHALTGFLVSPEFLFIRERSEPDPAQPGAFRLDGYSKAARLSYLLWNTTPDEQLLTAAERGDLHKPAGLRQQVDRMLASPLHQDGVRAFFSDFLIAEAFDTLTKDSTIYPGMTIKAVAEAREQMLRTIVDHLVTQNGDYRDLFTTRRTFLTSDLAQLYRVPVNLGSQGWMPYEFPADSPRAGLLTQIGFLAQYAHPGRSSVTRRGRAIREALLCQHVPDPPPNVDFSLFEDPKGGMMTARERLSAHNENPVCAGCHAMTDPMGLPLESFDGAGQHRLTESGLKIDTRGELDGVAFTDATGLGRALSRNAALKSCVVQRLYAYGKGRKTTEADALLIQGYLGQLDKQGYGFDRMLRMIVLDPAFFSGGGAPLTQPKLTVTKGGSYAHQDPSRFDRRRMLRGMLNGAAVTVSLPFLDCMLNDSGTAFAATGAALPQRYGTWFWGLGCDPHLFTPKTVGALGELTPQLAPLEKVKRYINVFTNFDVLTDGAPNLCHYTGWIALRTGAATPSRNFLPAPSFDTAIVDAIGGGTRFRSLQMAATGGPRDSYSFISNDAINPPEISAIDLYTKIFGPDFADPNHADFKPNPRIMLRKSVLSSVTDLRAETERGLGAADKARLDQYYTSIREIEDRLDLQLQKPPPAPTCAKPAPPRDDIPLGELVEVVQSRHRAMTDLLAMALVCNQTKVFNMVYSGSVSALTRKGMDKGHHTLTHEEPVDQQLGFQPQSSKFITDAMHEWAYFVERLAATPEGDGNLLDRCLVYAHSDCQVAKAHTLTGIPMFTAGLLGGKVKAGQHIDGHAQAGTRLGLTIQRLMGLSVGSWGTKSLTATQEIGEIVA